MRKKIFVALMIMVVALGLVACGGNDKGTSAPTTEEAKPIEEVEKKDESTIRKEECLGTYRAYSYMIEGLELVPEDFMELGYDVSKDSIVLTEDDCTITCCGNTMNLGSYTIDKYYNICPDKFGGKNSITLDAGTMTLEGIDPEAGEGCITFDVDGMSIIIFFRK